MSSPATPPDAAHPPTTGFLVWRLSMAWRTAVDRALDPLGVTHAQYALLGSLLGMRDVGHAPHQRELADHAGLEPLYVSKLARSLEAAGWVGRNRDATDSRAVRLTLTPAGVEVARAAVREVARLYERLLEPLGGPRSAPTQEFSRMLTSLLAVPIPPRPGATASEETSS